MAETVFDRFAKPPCAELLGWELIEADVDTGSIRVAFAATSMFCNPSGYIQGGFLAAMLDDTLGPTVLIKTDGSHHCATIDLHIHFLAPVKPARLIGEGRLIQLGKSVAFLEGELIDPDGRTIAKASASARVVPTAGLARS